LACNTMTYTPRSRKNIQREKPSVVLLDRIIEYRIEQNAWPFSREEFISRGIKFKEAFAGFPYLQTKFKVIDQETMIFTFWEHIRDVENYKQTNKIDLNSYAGEVRFFKENDKFIWKLKMR
ncbi:MAG TPA: hypothetical protein VFO70_04220, partial [Chitinophagaceae bacterium]|nr:hypothetical protein [Chitinophagaceae bacterium]